MTEQETIAPRSRDIYTNLKVSSGKLPKDVTFDSRSADNFLSLSLSLFLEDTIPEEYLEDSETAKECLALCVLAWNFGVAEADPRLSRHMDSIRKTLLATGDAQNLRSKMHSNFEKALRELTEAKIEDYGEFRDFIRSWEVGETFPEHAGDEEIPVSAKGCSPEEIDPKAFGK